MKLIPAVVEHFVSRLSSGRHSDPLEQPIDEEPFTPPAWSEPEVIEFTLSDPDAGLKEFHRQQRLKKEAAESRSQLKARRFEELCRQLRQGKRNSAAWLTEYEEFLRSGLWEVVSDQTLRNAFFKCEHGGCTQRAWRVQLLEFPEGFMKTGFDWAKHEHILAALCRDHYTLTHGLLMKTVVRPSQGFTQFITKPTKTTA